MYKLIGDFIDVGVELLNPVQVSAGEMGDYRLPREMAIAPSSWAGRQNPAYRSAPNPLHKNASKEALRS